MASVKTLPRPRVGVISIHPAPYRDPIFAALHERGVVEVIVVTLFDHDPGHAFRGNEKTNYPQIRLSKCYGQFRFWCFHPGLISALREARFDAIIVPGYAYLTLLSVIIYCRLTGTPYVLSGDKIRDSSTPALGGALAGRVSRFLWRMAAACWVPGKASRSHLCSLDVDDRSIFEGCYTLDYGALRTHLESWNKRRRETRHGLSMDAQGFVFLMVANVIPGRRHDILLKAFSRVVEECPDTYLLLVGKGADDETMARLIEGGASDHIRLAGPVPFDALPSFYAAADAYVHSGGEPYSTAVAYGAIAGKPIITTPEVGAASDYVIDGETGFLVDPEDVSGLAEKMLGLASDRENALRLGRNAGQLARDFTPEWAADQLEQAIAVATKGAEQAAGSGVR